MSRLSIRSGSPRWERQEFKAIGAHPIGPARGRRLGLAVAVALLASGGHPATMRAEGLAAARDRQVGPPSGRPLEASWIDRTRPTAFEGWMVRSDLGPEATGEVLSELSMLGGRFTGIFGPVGGRLRVWCFANVREAADTVRSLLGGEFERPRQAAHLPDPVGGRDGVIVVVPRSGDAGGLRRELARAVADFGVASRRSVPPWLAGGIVEWFDWSVRPAAGAEPVGPPPTLRADLRAAWREGRRLGVDRLIRLDPRAWKANLASGSGPLQRAEAGVLTAVLLGDPRTRAGVRRMLDAPRPDGTSPLAAWRSIWPTLSPTALDAAMDASIDRRTSRLESALREASWLAEGRARLPDGDGADTPDLVRSHMRDDGPAITEPCLAATGRCPMPAPAPVVEWTTLEADRWSGRVGPWQVTLEWRTFAGRTMGEVSVSRAAADD